MKPTICAMNSLSPDYSEPMDLITLAKVKYFFNAFEQCACSYSFFCFYIIG